MKKVAVTSATGQLGRAIIAKAINIFGKDNVVGLARTPSKAEDLGIEIRNGDYNNAQHFEDGLKGIEIVVILSGNDQPDNRIPQHRNIINGAKANGVRKIVYTSIFGDEGDFKFDAIIKSNRQTEQDVKDSGIEYAIGRNGFYIEPDVEYIPNYVKAGEIMNSAGEGKAGYTLRDELADAYISLIQKDDLNGGVYNLFGECIDQQELTNLINNVYGTELKYRAVSVEAYKQDRIAEHGEFLGDVIAGIYEGIHGGAFDLSSDFEKVTGRTHQTIESYLRKSKEG